MFTIKSISGSELVLLEEWPEPLPFDYKDNNTVSLSIFRGVINYDLDDSVKCVAIRVPMDSDEDMLNAMLSRFQEGKNLERKFFILSRQIFKDKDRNFMYFCSDSYEHNLQTLVRVGDQNAWREAIKHFLLGLFFLHESTKTHGHITYYNLVISNDGHGYLAGGVGKPFSYGVDKKRMLRLVEKSHYLGHDVTCLSNAIQCCFDNNMPRDLKYLVMFLRRHKKLNAARYHPFVLDSLGICSFMVSVQIFDKTCELFNGWNWLLERFELAKSNYGYSSPHNWIKDVRELNNPIVTGVFDYRSPGAEKSPSKYGNNDYSLARFCRNLLVHADKDIEVDIKEHCDSICDIINEQWPGFLCIVHDVAATSDYFCGNMIG